MTTTNLTDANGNPEEPLEGAPAVTARPDPEDHPHEDARIPDPGKDEGADTDRTPDDEDEQDTFPRAYVEKLRQENGKFRQRAQRADELAHRLHTSLVAATGLLQDATDLEYSEDHLDDPEALTAAVEALVARKPHLAARRPRGDVGQGATGSDGGSVDLAAMLRARA